MIKNILSCLGILLLLSCSSEQEKGLKVIATPVPHAEMLEVAKKELKEKGINLIIVVVDDYNTPNRSLANHEADANFFQHSLFMDEQIKQFHYPIHSIAKIEIEPMGIYSKRVKNLSELKDKATIALPNDPTNEARALLLLQEHGVIELDNPKNLQATILNIKKNPKHIHFIEVDAAMVPRSLDDVDAAAINTNWALQAHLNPSKDALVLESKDSPYANVLVIRKGDENRQDIQALKAAMTSEKMRAFILEKYQGAIFPAF